MQTYEVRLLGYLPCNNGIIATLEWVNGPLAGESMQHSVDPSLVIAVLNARAAGSKGHCEMSLPHDEQEAFGPQKRWLYWPPEGRA